jgi:hypothetical protein
MSLPFVQGNICQRLPIESESFDLAITGKTFEHIEDPARRSPSLFSYASAWLSTSTSILSLQSARAACVFGLDALSAVFLAR